MEEGRGRNRVRGRECVRMKEMKPKGKNNTTINTFVIRKKIKMSVDTGLTIYHPISLV